MKISVSDFQFSKFEIEDTTLSSDEEHVKLLRDVVKLMHDSIPIQKIEVTQIVDGVFYKIVLVDGRQWKNNIYCLPSSGNLDPFQTFNITDQWRQSEFSLHRVIRDQVIHLIADHGVTSIKIELA